MQPTKTKPPTALTESTVLWANNYLPMLYDMAWTFERHDWIKPFQHLTALCHEIDEILAKQQFVTPAQKRAARAKTEARA